MSHLYRSVSEYHKSRWLNSVCGLPLFVHLICKNSLYFCPGLPDPAPFSVRWMCLMMDLQYTLSVYLSLCHSHLKGVKLCANLSVKNMFTSDLLHDPGLRFLTVLYNLIQFCHSTLFVPGDNFLASALSVTYKETSKCFLLFKYQPFQ